MFIMLTSSQVNELLLCSYPIREHANSLTDSTINNNLIVTKSV